MSSKLIKICPKYSFSPELLSQWNYYHSKSTLKEGDGNAAFGLASNLKTARLGCTYQGYNPGRCSLQGHWGTQASPPRQGSNSREGCFFVCFFWYVYFCLDPRHLLYMSVPGLFFALFWDRVKPRKVVSVYIPMFAVQEKCRPESLQFSIIQIILLTTICSQPNNQNPFHQLLPCLLHLNFPHCLRWMLGSHSLPVYTCQYTWGHLQYRHILGVNISLDSYRPVDPGPHQVLAGRPSNVPPTVQIHLLSPFSTLCKQGLANVGIAPGIFSIYHPGNLLAVHVLLNSPCKVGVDDFQFHLFWHRKGDTWAHLSWWLVLLGDAWDM